MKDLIFNISSFTSHSVAFVKLIQTIIDAQTTKIYSSVTSKSFAELGYIIIPDHDTAGAFFHKRTAKGIRSRADKRDIEQWFEHFDMDFSTIIHLFALDRGVDAFEFEGML